MLCLELLPRVTEFVPQLGSQFTDNGRQLCGRDFSANLRPQLLSDQPHFQGFAVQSQHIAAEALQGRLTLLQTFTLLLQLLSLLLLIEFQPASLLA